MNKVFIWSIFYLFIVCHNTTRVVRIPLGMNTLLALSLIPTLTRDIAGLPTLVLNFHP